MASFRCFEHFSLEARDDKTHKGTPTIAFVRLVFGESQGLEKTHRRADGIAI